MITIQNYVRAKSLEEAYELNQKRSARILGGMLWLRAGNTAVHTAIDHAIYRATGVWHRELPITPQKVAMSQKK